ncbi:MAG: D-glycerate dehydrogenase [Aquificota bacterium]|nr:MAG: D-glycerate dehydrogenase [Aquificota bacterium]
MAKPKVLVTWPYLFPEADELLQRETEVTYHKEERPMSRQELMEALSDKEGLLCMLFDKIDGEVLDAGPHLKVVSNLGVGLDNIDIEAATQRGVVITHTPGILTEATADLGWALLMATTRLIPQAHAFTKEGRFIGLRYHIFLGKDLVGKTLGIYGMGRIGTAVARRAKGFNMKIIYHNRRPNPEGERETGARYVSFQELLKESDFLVIVAPLTPETQGRFGSEEFRQMKRDAILINIGRGPIVKEKELVQALKEGLIWGAGLDVYEREPEIEEGLLGLDRVVLSPHIGSATVETRSAMALVAAQDLVRVLKGEKPQHSPNWERKD